MPRKDLKARADYLKKYRSDHLNELRAYDKKRNEERSAVNVARVRRWRIDNPEKAKAGDKRRRKPHWMRRISRKEYNARLKQQHNRCALCTDPFTTTDPPVLDHSHARNVNRGLIHNRCNLGLGQFRDDPKICRLAAEYLERSEK